MNMKRLTADDVRAQLLKESEARNITGWCQKIGISRQSYYKFMTGGTDVVPKRIREELGLKRVAVVYVQMD